MRFSYTFSTTSVVAYLIIISQLIGVSEQHGLFKVYLLGKLMLKKGPRLVPIPIPIKIPHEAKIIKIPVVHTSHHVHVHYHGTPTHGTQPGARTWYEQNHLVEDALIPLNRIDHGYRTQAIANGLSEFYNIGKMPHFSPSSAIVHS